MTTTHLTDPEPICGHRAASCYCELEPDHEGPVHVCACNGAWVGPGGDYIRNGDVVLFPEGRSPDDVRDAEFAALMSMLYPF